MTDPPFSLPATGGSIGATDLFHDATLKFETDMSNTKVAGECLKRLLSPDHTASLESVGRNAQRQSVGWSPVEHCEKMKAIIAGAASVDEK